MAPNMSCIFDGEGNLPSTHLIDQALVKTQKDQGTDMEMNFGREMNFSYS